MIITKLTVCYEAIFLYIHSFVVLLLQYASTLVTYIIVLLQLNMGQPSYFEMNGTQNSNNAM